MALTVSRVAFYHNTVEIIRLIQDIRHVFESHFDRSWIAGIVDDLPMESRLINEIRYFLSLTSLGVEDGRAVSLGIKALRQYIDIIRRQLLPCVKEKFGISAFSGTKTMDKSLYILRQFAAYALPFNLEKLSRLTLELDYLMRQEEPAPWQMNY